MAESKEKIEGQGKEAPKEERAFSGPIGGEDGLVNYFEYCCDLYRTISGEYQTLTLAQRLTHQQSDIYHLALMRLISIFGELAIYGRDKTLVGFNVVGGSKDKIWTGTQLGILPQVFVDGNTVPKQLIYDRHGVSHPTPASHKANLLDDVLLREILNRIFRDDRGKFSRCIGGLRNYLHSVHDAMLTFRLDPRQFRFVTRYLHAGDQTNLVPVEPLALAGCLLEELQMIKTLIGQVKVVDSIVGEPGTFRTVQSIKFDHSTGNPDVDKFALEMLFVRCMNLYRDTKERLIKIDPSNEFMLYNALFKNIGFYSFIERAEELRRDVSHQFRRMTPQQLKLFADNLDNFINFVPALIERAQAAKKLASAASLQQSSMSLEHARAQRRAEVAEIRAQIRKLREQKNAAAAAQDLSAGLAASGHLPPAEAPKISEEQAAQRSAELKELRARISALRSQRNTAAIGQGVGSGLQAAPIHLPPVEAHQKPGISPEGAGYMPGYTEFQRHTAQSHVDDKASDEQKAREAERIAYFSKLTSIMFAILEENTKGEFPSIDKDEEGKSDDEYSKVKAEITKYLQCKSSSPEQPYIANLSDPIVIHVQRIFQEAEKSLRIIAKPEG